MRPAIQQAAMSSFAAFISSIPHVCRMKSKRTSAWRCSAEIMRTRIPACLSATAIGKFFLDFALQFDLALIKYEI